jgi:prepilin-type N-terminal cleavage/methylation domain-containing protein
MIARLQNRIAQSKSEGGFTLIELLVVIIIIGILLAIAVPSYMSFRGRAADSAAQANLRAVVPSVETYFSDNGTYVGMDLTALRAIDQSIGGGIAVVSVAAADYCLSSVVGGRTFYKAGPADAISATACT